MADEPHSDSLSEADPLAVRNALAAQLGRAFGDHDFVRGDDLLAQYSAEVGKDETYWGFCAELAIVRGELETAIEYNQNILVKYPDDFWSVFRLAKIAMRRGDLAGARTYIQKAMRLQPDNPNAVSLWAKVLLIEGRVEDAIKTLYGSLQKNPSDIWTLVDLLKIYDAQGRYAEGLALANNSFGRMSKTAQKILKKEIKNLRRNWRFEGAVRRNFDDIFAALGGCVLVDVGAAGGLFWKWEILSRMGVVKGIGFEPDADECRASQALYPHNIFLPIAIAGKSGKTKLRIARNAPCTSLLLPDLEEMRRWPIRACFETIRTIEIEAVTLKKALKDAGIEKIDFLKVDVQGAENQILAGAGEYLDQLIGIELETHMVALYKTETVFTDLTKTLRKSNFRLRGVEPQGSFEGEVVEIEAFYGRDTAGLSDLELQRLFLWEAVSNCPKLPFMGDNKKLKSYPELAATMTERDYKIAKIRRDVRKWVKTKKRTKKAF